MSPDVLQWVKIAHIIGFVLWVSGLSAGYWLLRLHSQVEKSARDAFVGAERAVGALMDAGATFAMVAGLVMAFGQTPIAFKTGGWLHVKLTLVVLGILSVHGKLRVTMKKYRNGEVTPMPSWVWPLLMVAVAGIIVLGAHPTLLRK
jgi:protoporphyrinogen IX oxidase